jgi:hypothetical protein
MLRGPPHRLVQVLVIVLRIENERKQGRNLSVLSEKTCIFGRFRGVFEGGFLAIRSLKAPNRRNVK